MRLQVRGKLFLVSVALLLVALVPGSFYLERSLRSQLEMQVEGELFHHARTVRETIQLVSQLPTIQTADELADRLARALEARVTLIASDGSILGDSEIPLERIRDVENHGDRPEVIAALATGQGTSRHYSSILETQMLYVAVPFERPDGRGVVRVAMPLHEVDRAVSGLRLVLLVAAGLALGLAVFMSALASHFYSRPLRRLVHRVRSVAEGKAGHSIAVSSRDEIKGLIGSFNRMSDELHLLVSTLAEERDRFEAVLEGMDDGVLALDRLGVITHANSAAIHLLGLSDPPIGKSLLKSINSSALREMVEEVGPDHPASCEFDFSGDRIHRLLARATALRRGGGTVVVIDDVTELRRLETVRQDFVANVSHELRTPVSVIQANSETLLNGALQEPDRASEFLEAMHRNANRLASLIADLLDISRIDSGQYSLETRPVSVASTVRQALESVERAARRKELEVKTDVGPELRALADEKSLHQVILNLLDNAVKYTPRGGQVAIRAQGNSESVRIEVHDNGPGIEPAHRDRIFERFYRVDTGRSREMGGTGLGLSIVKNLVDIMGGEVGAKPASPHGSIFWISLPADQAG